MSGYSWIFNVRCDDDLPFHFTNPAKVCFSVIFKVMTNNGKCYMGYVQFLLKQDPEALKAKYPTYQWFESTNDPVIYSAYMSAPCATGEPLVFGSPRPKIKHFAFVNPIHRMKNKLREVIREEFRQAALDLLKPQ